MVAVAVKDPRARARDPGPAASGQTFWAAEASRLRSEREAASAALRQQTAEDNLPTAPTQFSVSMPHLQQVPPQLHRLTHPVRNALHFVAMVDLPNYLDHTHLPTEMPVLANLPANKNRLTLVLDLDETLVHCRPEPLPIKHDFMVRFEEAQADGWIYVRPFAGLFLEIVARLFEVVVFTASSRCYADQVLDTLDPDGSRISTRLYRQHCTEVGGGFLKDMRRLGRGIEQVLLIDNSPVSVAMCPDNGIICSSWVGDNPEDRELLDLLLVLQQCVLHGSVPDFLAHRYGLRVFLDDLRYRPDLLGF